MSEETVDDLLLISGSKGSKEADKEYAKKISNAVLSCIEKYGTAQLRCVGAAAENNAIKGITIARKIMIQDDNYLFIRPEFTMVDFNGVERTGILIKVKKYEGHKKDKDLNYDDSLLKVMGDQGSKEANTQYVKKLANAILSCFEKQNTALLRYVGAAAGNNAIKAAAISIVNAEENGINLVFDPCFTLIDFDNKEITGIILEAVKID